MSDLIGPIAVTGASGFIASHIIGELLKKGVTVHGTVRDLEDSEKFQHLQEISSNMPGKLELFEADLLKFGSFDGAFKGCETVIHAAAVVLMESSEPQSVIVDPSVEGTKNILDTIVRVGGVKRLIHTSSVAAIRGGVVEDGYVYTEDDWNITSTLEKFPYGLAKASAEKLARDFNSKLDGEEKFHYVSINPVIVFGAPFTKAHSKGSNSVIWNLLMKKFHRCPKISISVVDVRDVVAAHINAFKLSVDEPTRFILCGSKVSIRELSEIGRRLYPKYRWPKGEIPNFITLLFARLGAIEYSVSTLKSLIKRSETYDSRCSKEILGIDYRDLDDTINYTVGAMIDRGFATPKLR